MVAQKSTPFALRTSIAALRSKIALLESEQSDLEQTLKHLRRRKHSWEVYDQIVAASDRLIALTLQITKLYSRLTADINRLSAIERANAKEKPAPKPASKPKQSAAARAEAERIACEEAERLAIIEARRERDRQRSAVAYAKKKEAQRLEAERIAREEAERIAREEVAAERERQRKLSKSQKEKQRRQKKKIDADFGKSTEDRLDTIYHDRPLTEVQPLKGVTFAREYAKLPPVESVDWRKVFTNVEDHFVDVWGIWKRLRSPKRDTNEKLIAGLKPATLLEILNADVAIENVNKQLARLPRLVRHPFPNDAEAEVARSYTGVELCYPEGMKPFAWIFVPDPNATYEAWIEYTPTLDGTSFDAILRIEQPLSKITEGFVPFTPTQFLDPQRVAEEIARRYPNTIAAFVRAGAFGLARLNSQVGHNAGDISDLIESLARAISNMQTKYSPGGEMGEQSDPDNPRSRHWKNWMTGIVVFETKDEKDIWGYITRYNAIMKDRKAQRKIDNENYKAAERAAKKK